MATTYEVLLGNIGRIVWTESYALAMRVFEEYARRDEDVTLLQIPEKGCVTATVYRSNQGGLHRD